MDRLTTDDIDHGLFYGNQPMLDIEQEFPSVVNEKHQGTGDTDVHAQLALLTKERDSLYVLWQTSQRTIEALENELKTYQSYGDRGQQQYTKEDKRDSELKLESALTDYLELESKYKLLQSKVNNLEQDLKSNDKEIHSYKEKITRLNSKVEELNKSIEELRINLATEKKCNEDVKHQLRLAQKEIVNKVKKEAEAKLKVAEALQLFDVVSAQKNEAFKKIGELTGELSQAKNMLSNVKREAESSFRNELDELRDKYNDKIADMLNHIRNLDSELIEKGLLLGKALREIKILKQENENYVKHQEDCLNALDPKLQLAEQRMETMFQELVASERRNIQIVSEKQCLAIEMQRVQDLHAREIKRRDWEENLLKTQCQELKAQVEHLQKSLDETHGMVSKLQNMLASRTELTQKMVSTKEQELIELNKHLENQMELSRKWKESYVEMTEKLKKRLEDIEKENKELRAHLKLPYIDSGDEEEV